MLEFSIPWSVVALFFGAAFGAFVAREWRGGWRWLLRFRFHGWYDTYWGVGGGRCRLCGWDNSCSHPDEHTLRACLRYRFRRVG